MQNKLRKRCALLLREYRHRREILKTTKSVFLSQDPSARPEKKILALVGPSLRGVVERGAAQREHRPHREQNRKHPSTSRGERLGV